MKWNFGVVCDKSDVMLSVFPGGAPVEAPVWVALVAADDPAFDFVEKSRLAVEYTDYTRKVTCLIEIGSN